MLSEKLRDFISTLPDNSPQVTILKRFIISISNENVCWVDFVSFIKSFPEDTYESLFCVMDPLKFLPNKVARDVFKEFYLSYPHTDWVLPQSPEVDCFYPGNLEPVAEQQALYTSGVYYIPTRALYATFNHMPVLYPFNTALVDRGPQAHSAQPVSSSSFRFFNPIDQGLSLFCARRRAAKGVEVTLDRSSGEESRVSRDDAFRYVPQFWRMSLAQEGDIRSHQARVTQAMQGAAEGTRLVIVGVSRGAATVVTSLSHAYQQPNYRTSPFANIAGVILEAPFNQVIHDVESSIYFNSHIIPKIMEHNPDGVSPANQVVNFPPGMPVLFITSRADKKVPMQSTATLARNLADRGQNPVYLLVLEFSAHPTYVYQHPYDRHKYLTAVHAFRSSCGLAHNARLAAAGEEYLAQARLMPAVTMIKAVPCKSV